jgi:hypothetical protein
VTPVPVSDASLSRLVFFIPSPLPPGCDSNLVRQITNLRNALERRVSSLVFGEEHTITDALTKVLRLIRIGRFDLVRLLVLVGKDDKGTKVDPLKSLASMSKLDAIIAFGDAIEKLKDVIAVATPTSFIYASPFLNKLKKNTVASIQSGVKMSVVSKWFAAVLTRVAQPRRQYSLGDGGSPLANFDLKFIDLRTDEFIELDLKTHEARAAKSAGEVFDQRGGGKQQRVPKSPGGGPSGQKGDRKPDPNSKRQKKLAAKKAAAAAKGSAADDDDDDDAGGDDEPTHGDGVVPGTKVPNPAADPSLTSAKEKQDAWNAFNTAHPKAKPSDTNFCWDFFHPQGCKNGSNCKYAHA